MSIPLPEYHKYEDFQIRTKKLHEIRALGLDPYPHKFSITHTPKELHKLYEGKEIGHSEEATLGKTPSVKIAGRLMLFRPMGKNIFGQLQDETGRIQIMCTRDVTTVEGYDPKKSTEELTPFKFIEKKLDLGDIIGVEGNLFYTQKGELTILVKQLTLLCKTLLPLPEKHSGITDKGVLYRKRWLDLIIHKESVDRFKARSKIIKIIRNYLDEADFLEVETNVLQNVYGGAQAKPFISHMNALHQDLFMRISLEIPLKKLIVGGLLKVYEMGKVFRNEGIDHSHNPEFTELEAYAAYWDYNDMMVFIEKLFESIALKMHGSTKVKIADQEVDFKAPWKRISMKDSLKIYANIEVDNLSDEQMKQKLITEKHFDPKTLKDAKKGELIAELFAQYVEEKLIQPHHIIDHPIETTPLCKLHRNPKEKSERLVERFESFVMASEMCNAYTELNDPELQRELLVEQALKKQKGDEEASPLDEEFIEAICQGLPPTSGFGIGIDRLVMLFTDTTAIKDVLYFPIMKPEE